MKLSELKKDLIKFTEFKSIARKAEMEKQNFLLELIEKYRLEKEPGKISESFTLDQLKGLYVETALQDDKDPEVFK